MSIDNIDGHITQNIPYGEVFVEERNGNWNTPYLFNAKELDEETGLYYYGARYLDPAIALWLSTDPLQGKYPGMSPYNYCAGNPVKMVDPDGRDNITVDENGFVSKVEKQVGDNTFHDKKGNLLTFNDIEEVDKGKTSNTFEKGDRVYMELNSIDVLDAIKKVKQNKNIKEGKNRYWNIYKASHGEADFTFSFLDSYYEKHREPESESSIMTTENGFLRTKYQEDIIYFKFEDSNTLYNLYDSGNFMWGAWSVYVGITDSEAEWGPSLNEIFSGGDSEADKRAIKNGRSWITNKYKHE
ncbi:MAG: RHS repeat-associated core domain-containing protein [Paludibacteraceae bacterium]|nr:RHS repeat-associated core domain-containing protein [Paludibacteraceae bacterium]